MTFLLSDIFLSVLVLSATICLIKIVVSAYIFQNSKEHMSYHRQKAFLVSKDYGKENTMYLPCSMFYKYGMIRSICKKEARGESDEIGPYFSVIYVR